MADLEPQAPPAPSDAALADAPDDGEETRLPVVEVVPGGEALLSVETTPEERDDAKRGRADDAAPPRLSGDELSRAAIALVFASPDPVPAARIAAALGAAGAEVREALEAAKGRIAEARLPFELTEIGGGWRFLTDASFEPWIARLQGLNRSEKLSAAAVETLAIVAYRQPVTKAEIETIRGVQAAPILKSLLDRRLVRVVGRAPVPGRPMQYGTTKDFLDRFGLRAASDLPSPEEVSAG